MKFRSLIFPIVLCGITTLTQAQVYYYSFPLYSIINAMPGGLKLPDGTKVKVDKFSTGGAVPSTANGTAGNATNMGGTFSGSTLPAYTGSKVPGEFTVIEANTQTVDNGEGNNCKTSIGFRVYFDRPTANINFLAVDMDGGYNGTNNPGNAEWVSYMAFNGNAFVPYNETKTGTNLANANVPIGVSHTWRTLVTNSLSATAAANIPAILPVKYASNNNLQPDDLTSQVFFSPVTATDLVTDYFCLWGIYPQTNNAGQQRSGVSPIVVSVKSDFGDAPDSYKTLLASGGPSHGVIAGLSLGYLNEYKLDGKPSAMSNLDPDDDGVASITPIINTQQAVQTIPSYSITTTYVNNTGRAANYVCWIDWNGNGTFEPSEAQTAVTPTSSTNGSVTFTWTNAQLTGVGNAINTYARIRMTTEQITTSDVGGAFSDGEAEDYFIPLITPLAVKLADFAGSLQNGHAQLNWHTTDEKNTKSFVVEYAANGGAFTTVGEIPATGSGSNGYSFMDANPARNINYYRLKMIDDDGLETFSKIICLKSANIAPLNVTLAPNPVYSSVQLNIVSEYALTIQMYDILGNVIYTMKTPATDRAVVDCANLAAGTYFMKITNDAGETKTLQFVKN